MLHRAVNSSPLIMSMKNWFNPARYQTLADELAALAPGFDRRRFLRVALDGLEQLELMDRLRRTTAAFAAATPGDFRRQVAILRELAPRIEHGFVGIWPCDFVATHGLGDPAFALAALRDLTRYGSAEFAVRPFLARDLPGTLKVMRAWADEADEHVRRLASEGSRPRLPWGQRLTALVADPSPTGPILEALRADPALYVRKSVANHLNDIAKDHPAAVLDRVERWDRADARTAWIVRHAIRTLVKRGEPRALALLGAGAPARLDVAAFTVTPRRLRLGDTVTLAAELTSATRREQTLVIDYVVHYVKATGRHTAKVFKWTTATLGPGGPLRLIKRQTIRDFSTRRHHPGVHRVELQVNGRRLAESTFTLRA
jgi:3-methyladenine DNA glycosylase AlkC